jgi:hypothetical protein
MPTRPLSGNRSRGDEKKMGKTMDEAAEKLDRASFLLYGIKSGLDETAAVVKKIKEGPDFDIKPLCKQGELFSFGGLPEENKPLAKLCLGSLVETL